MTTKVFKEKMIESDMERQPCEIFSRCCGYMRPTSNWNEGKQSEFKDRLMFKTNTD